MNDNDRRMIYEKHISQIDKKHAILDEKFDFRNFNTVHMTISSNHTNVTKINVHSGIGR